MRTEDQLWNFLKPRLLGWWTRIEASTPAGVLDSFGFYAGETHWLELKVGPPNVLRLEPMQYDFLTEAKKFGVSAWVVFHHADRLHWFKWIPAIETDAPVFYRPKAVAHVRRRVAPRFPTTPPQRQA